MYIENLVEINVAQYKFYLFGFIANKSRKVRKRTRNCDANLNEEII